MPGTIRTPDQRLRVFISSTMVELAAERAAARRAIERLRLIPVLFELGARPHPPRDLYRAYLRQSDIFIGIYGQQYGWVAPGSEISGIEDEYQLAAGMPKLVYVQPANADRAPRLAEMLDRIKSDGLSYRTFSRPSELTTLIVDDVAILLSERFNDQDPDVAVPEAEARPYLPSPGTRFIGRKEDLEQLQRWAEDDGSRLLSLVGPGGIGKTRLALQFAQIVASRFDRVVFVELEQVSTASSVPSLIAAAMQLPERSDRSALERTRDYLASHRVLLILDNFEQVMAAAPALGQLVADAAAAKVLATSRERLRLSNERVFDLPPLSVPAASDRQTSAAQSESVELFLDRAAAMGAAVDLGGQELELVTEICRRLEGLPLAIELAAARTRTLGLEELLHRLDNQLRILTSGARDLPARQQALRSTIQWSYDLLPTAERRLFAQLGVFAGSFSLTAAERICTGDLDVDVMKALRHWSTRRSFAPRIPSKVRSGSGCCR